jgi:hypothetical protein
VKSVFALIMKSAVVFATRILLDFINSSVMAGNNHSGGIQKIAMF